jgi:GNAT superfamily N-acetyltransferase
MSATALPHLQCLRGLPAPAATPRRKLWHTTWRMPRPLPSARPLELRIDVDLPAELLANDLRRLHQRLRTPGDALHCSATLPVRLPGLELRHRVADGEHYVYVEDRGLNRLAGFVVFNRLIELNRRADRVLRSPHTRIAPEYRRHGIATAVYRWALEQGICLISGPRQSPAAHALWHRLAQHHPLRYAHLQDKRLTDLGPQVADEVLEDFHTRMVLWGVGWDEGRFAREAEMSMRG